MENKIAEALVAQMIGQMDMLFGISAAVCGGIVLFCGQIITHNASPDKTPVKIKGINLLVACFVLQGLSMCCGYLGHGSITSLIPAIYKHANPDIVNWTMVEFEGSTIMRITPFLQFVMFIIGLMALLYVAVSNIGVMKNEK